MKKNITSALQNLELLILSFYKVVISLTLKFFFGGGCRYEPTCSEYSRLAIIKFGPFKGTALSIKRFLSCNPLSKHSRDYPLE